MRACYAARVTFWLVSLPSVVLFVLLIGAAVVVAVGGLFLTRPLARKLQKHSHDETEFVGAFIQGTGALYGILLGLVAVAAWNDYKAAEDLVSRESAALGAFYADVSGLREPARDQLRALTRDYVNYTIDVAWPAQRTGQHPTLSNAYLRAIRKVLQAYEPDTAGQANLHGEALRKMNELIEHRRKRVETIYAALPNEVWAMVLIGALATLALTWLLPKESIGLHVCLEVLLAVFLGISFFVLVAFDRPLVGTTSVDAAPYVLIRDRIIAAEPPHGPAPALPDGAPAP